MYTVDCIGASHRMSSSAYGVGAFITPISLVNKPLQECVFATWSFFSFFDSTERHSIISIYEETNFSISWGNGSPFSSNTLQPAHQGSGFGHQSCVGGFSPRRVGISVMR